MIDHATEVLPLEAVGLLGGADCEAKRRISLPNALGTKRFLADPYAQFLAFRQLSAEGLSPLAIYHSHPGGGVRLSDEDIFFAARLPYLQLVIAIDRKHNPAVEIAAYLVQGQTIKNAILEVVLEETKWP
jgi:proteasome lid subunit RPN8/RPN11